MLKCIKINAAVVLLLCIWSMFMFYVCRNNTMPFGCRLYSISFLNQLRPEPYNVHKSFYKLKPETV
jgi:hypothetical protein